MEGNQVSARRGEEYVINRPMYLFVQPAFSSAGNRARNGVAKSSRSKTCLFSSILSMRICDRSAQFPVNCFEKFLWQQIIADLIQPTCFLVSEKRRKRERSGKE